MVYIRQWSKQMLKCPKSIETMFNGHVHRHSLLFINYFLFLLNFENIFSFQNYVFPQNWKLIFPPKSKIIFFSSKPKKSRFPVKTKKSCFPAETGKSRFPAKKTSNEHTLMDFQVSMLLLLLWPFWLWVYFHGRIQLLKYCNMPPNSKFTLFSV